LYEHWVFDFFLLLHHPNNHLQKYLFLFSICLSSIQQQKPALRQEKYWNRFATPLPLPPSYAYAL
jgi:hypothetical protein